MSSNQQAEGYERQIQAALAEYIATFGQKDAPSIRKLAEDYNISRNTLSRRIKGGLSQAEANSQRSHLSSAESEALIDWIIQLSNQGFPPTLQRIEDMANLILSKNAKTPSATVGHNWVDRWLQKHDKYVSKYWSTSLETVRAKSLTPQRVDYYFTLLDTIITGKNIDPDCIYGMDETSLLMGRGKRKQRVVGEAKKRVQHTQGEEGREGITLIVSASATGHILKPVLIFKGIRYNMGWQKVNPLEAL